MALKIDANMSATAHHIVDGPVLFPYAIDAQSAISRHPDEWSADPWSQADADAARNRINERNKEAGAPLLAEPIPATPEEQKAIDEHAKAVAEANDRLKAFREKQAEEKKIAEQVAADEALVASAPPRPDPNARRPTPAQLRKQSAQLTPEEQKMVDDKAREDELAAHQPAH